MDDRTALTLVEVDRLVRSGVWGKREVCRYFYGFKKRLWRSADWKRIRARKLGISCGTCGAYGGRVVFVLQHRFQPRTYMTLLSDKLTLYGLAQYHVQILRRAARVERLRKNTGKDRSCEIRATDTHVADEVRGIYAEACLEWVAEWRRYASCVDCVTLCRECAYKEDCCGK
jgi:hypothetical protein